RFQIVARPDQGLLCAMACLAEQGDEDDERREDQEVRDMAAHGRPGVAARQEEVVEDDHREQHREETRPPAPEPDDHRDGDDEEEALEVEGAEREPGGERDDDRADGVSVAQDVPRTGRAHAASTPGERTATACTRLSDSGVMSPPHSLPLPLTLRNRIARGQRRARVACSRALVYEREAVRRLPGRSTGWRWFGGNAARDATGKRDRGGMRRKRSRLAVVWLLAGPVVS